MAELVGALSLATDSANGVRPQTAIRTAILSVELARAAAQPSDVCRAAFWTALLRFIGCTSFAHETARWAAGDDLRMLAELQTIDVERPSTVLLGALRASRGAGAPARASAIVRLVASGDASERFAQAHCSQADSLARSLGAPALVRSALGDLYERFDGLGAPRRARGDAISIVARIVHVAAWAEAHASSAGHEAAVAAVEAMRGRSLDPALATVFVREIASTLAEPPTAIFEAMLDREPEPRWTIDDPEPVFEAFAKYADLKSPFLLGHSTGVASLVDRTAESLGFSQAERSLVRRAALVHDVGRVALPNGIWDSAAPLGRVEREAIESHATHTERILAFGEQTRSLALVASAAHERQDETGYPHRRAPRDRCARLLAACDVLHALGEERPHRRALDAEARAKILLDDVRLSKLDRVIVDAALATARGRAIDPRARGAALSEREIEVLVELARGASNKEIAVSLGVSPKTVQHHVAHVYEKTGVKSRAAAALYAVEHGLVVSKSVV